MTMKTKKIQLNKSSDFREHQQDLTELNADGNRERGHYGEDLKKEEVHENCGTPDCCGGCDTASTTPEELEEKLSNNG